MRCVSCKYCKPESSGFFPSFWVCENINNGEKALFDNSILNRVKHWHRRRLYCNSCKWYKTGMIDDDCVHKKNVIEKVQENYKERKIILECKSKPSEMNKNNDCKLYEWRDDSHEACRKKDF